MGYAWLERLFVDKHMFLMCHNLIEGRGLYSAQYNGYDSNALDVCFSRTSGALPIRYTVPGVRDSFWRSKEQLISRGCI